MATHPSKTRELCQEHNYLTLKVCQGNLLLYSERFCVLKTLWPVFRGFVSCVLRKYLNESYFPVLNHQLPVHCWAA